MSSVNGRLPVTNEIGQWLFDHSFCTWTQLAELKIEDLEKLISECPASLQTALKHYWTESLLLRPQLADISSPTPEQILDIVSLYTQLKAYLVNLYSSMTNERFSVANLFVANCYPSPGLLEREDQPNLVLLATIGEPDPDFKSLVNSMFPAVNIHWKLIGRKVHIQDDNTAMKQLQQQYPEKYANLSSKLRDKNVQRLFWRKDVVAIKTSAAMDDMLGVRPQLRVFVVDTSIYDSSFGPIPAELQLDIGGSISIELVEGWFYLQAGSLGGVMGSAISSQQENYGYGTIGPLVKKNEKFYLSTCEHVINELKKSDTPLNRLCSPGYCRRLFDLLNATDISTISSGGTFAQYVVRKAFAEITNGYDNPNLKLLLGCDPITLQRVYAYTNENQLEFGRVENVVIPTIPANEEDENDYTADIALIEIPEDQIPADFYGRRRCTNVTKSDSIQGETEVVKIGASTRETGGVIGYGSADISYNHASGSILTATGRPRVIKNCLVIHSDYFSAKGDSGAAVFATTANKMDMMGIFVGTSNHEPPFFIASPMDTLIDDGYSIANPE